jgi:uncharacterized protein (DUF427 family)
MIVAKWKGKEIAKSDDTVIIENNHYFHKDDVNMEYLEPTDTNTTCHWKGVASYYSVVVDGETNKDAAWYYPNAKDAAKEIENRIAFWKGVEIIED